MGIVQWLKSIAFKLRIGIFCIFRRCSQHPQNTSYGKDMDFFPKEWYVVKRTWQQLCLIVMLSWAIDLQNVHYSLVFTEKENNTKNVFGIYLSQMQRTLTTEANFPKVSHFKYKSTRRL